MATLGVLSCQILELEFSYILANDGDISEIIVMDNLTIRAIFLKQQVETTKVGGLILK